MKRLGKGKEWEITDQNGTTWNYKAVTRMKPFRSSRPIWSEYEEQYLCWHRQRYYISEFERSDVGSFGLSLFEVVSSISYSE